jgi:hexulose-6-phosphate isomerase
MKIGVNVWSLPGGWSLEKAFGVAKAAGFDGVEVALDETGEVGLDLEKSGAERIREMAAKAGIELYSVATGLYWKYSLTSADPAARSKAKSIVKKQLEIASWLGCDTILVVPGAVGVDFVPGCEIVPYDAAYERAAAAIDETKGFAEQLGVDLGVENVWNKFLLSPLEMRDFIDRAGSARVGAYFDVGNTLLTGYPEHWIKILGVRIKKVHFKDFRRSVGTLDGFVDMLSGDVDYPAVMGAFRDAGYDGWVTAEVSPCADYPEHGARNLANAMRAIVAGG